jgi:hypothetical protein
VIDLPHAEPVAGVLLMDMGSSSRELYALGAADTARGAKSASVRTVAIDFPAINVISYLLVTG